MALNRGFQAAVCAIGAKVVEWLQNGHQGVCRDIDSEFQLRNSSRTREWWNRARNAQTDLVTSVAVTDELERGDFATRSDCLGLIEQLRVMSADPAGDALHLALASYHRCEFLVTWNCRHLANANKFGHIRRVNTLLGLLTPALVTPLELLGDTNDED